MSDFCVKCNSFIQVIDLDETAAYDHIENFHRAEMSCKEDYQTFIDVYILDHEAGLEILAYEWIQHSKDVSNVEGEIIVDPSLRKLIQKGAEIEKALNDCAGMIAEIRAPYAEKISKSEARKQEIEEVFRDQHSETVKALDLEPLRVEFRETKSLKILDFERAVDILVANKKVAEGVKSFNVPFMRKLKDVGLLDDAVAAYDSKINVYVRPKEEITLEPEESA